MSSLVGHALGATVVWEAGRRLTGDQTLPGKRWYALPCVAAALPDLDVVVPMLFDVPADHRGASHSLPAAVVLAAAAAGVAVSLARGAEFGRTFALLVPCTFLHPVLDFLMGRGPPIEFLWPWVTEGWLSPIQVVPTAYYPTHADALIAVLLYGKTWIGIGFELVAFGPLLLALRSRPPDTLVWIATSVVAFSLIVLAYN
ncbi:MAG: metal-dependent hydrolase [Planctomycetota bacterium]